VSERAERRLLAGGISASSAIAAVGFGSPRKLNFSGPSFFSGSAGSEPMTTIWPGPISPNRIFSDSGSSISRWMVRRSGRAPSTGS
jgi:hypothetical protein